MAHRNRAHTARISGSSLPEEGLAVMPVSSKMAVTIVFFLHRLSAVIKNGPEFVRALFA